MDTLIQIRRGTFMQSLTRPNSFFCVSRNVFYTSSYSSITERSKLNFNKYFFNIARIYIDKKTIKTSFEKEDKRRRWFSLLCECKETKLYTLKKILFPSNEPSFKGSELSAGKKLTNQLRKIKKYSSLCVYKIEIQKNHSVDKIPSTNFRIVDYKINSVILNILIEYQSQGNPEVQAVWDEKSNKFYLVGGKINRPVVIRTKHAISCTLAETNQAWISIDLSPLRKKGEMNIYGMMPATFIRDESPLHHSVKLSDASDTVLIKVII